MYDVLIFLPDPLVSLPNLVEILEEFHTYSGLGVNMKKCSALPINLPIVLRDTKECFGFTINGHTLQYLGIKLAPSLSDMYNANYPQAFARVKQWLKMWAKFTISLLGRITAIKMSILPKLLYYFRALPVYVSRQTIEQIQREVNKFIWKDKRLRFGKLISHIHLSRGGLGLPDLWRYFLEARLAQTAQWHAQSNSIPWLRIERASVRPWCLQELLWKASVRIKAFSPLNSIVAQTLHLWSLYNQKFKLSSLNPPP